jgi:hypothetical protein
VKVHILDFLSCDAGKATALLFAALQVNLFAALQVHQLL